MKFVKNYKTILIIVLVISMTVFMVSASALSIAYRTPSYIRRSVKTKLLESDAHISFNYHIKPSILFDNKTEISSKSIYLSLARGVSYNITINTKYYADPLYGEPTNKTISIIKTIEISTVSWRKIVTEKNIDVSNDTITDNGYVSFDKYNSFVKEINNQIGINPLGYTIKIRYKLVYTIYYGYAHRVYDFSPAIVIDYDELNKIVKTRTTNTTLFIEKDSTAYIPGNTTILGTEINTVWLREKTFYSTLLSATIMLSALGAIAYYMISDSNNYLDRVLKKYKSRIFYGKFIHDDKEIIKVGDIRDIIRASELYGEIIIYDRDRNRLVVNTRNNIFIYENSELDKIL